MAAPTLADLRSTRADVRTARVDLINAINTKSDVEGARFAEREARTTLAGKIADWLAVGTPATTVDEDFKRLEAGQAIVMFPVRIETRFDSTGAPLRIRLYPDEISLNTHERPLTDDEEAAGKAYYTGFRKPKEDPEEKRWQDLVSRFGAPRAAYIARVMRPELESHDTTPLFDCTDEWKTLVPDPDKVALVFPQPLHRPGAWTRPGEAVLPDRWIVAGYRGGARTLLKVGNAIPEPLVLTPEPDGDDPVSVDGFSIDRDLAWTIDYAKAESIGMAITVLASDDSRVDLGYDRLIVIGVKTSLEPRLPPIVVQARAPGAAVSAAESRFPTARVETFRHSPGSRHEREK